MKKYLSCLAAIMIAAICYAMARLPALTSSETDTLAARFSFKKSPLPEVANHPPYKSVRQVHPSLERIAAWVSSLGAAATLADLDGDGLANDIIYVDPRTDLVTVAPVPGTGERYELFAIDNAFWSNGSYDVTTVAPMGTIAGGDGPGPFTPDTGVAPGAEWISAKGCETFGCTSEALLSLRQRGMVPPSLDTFQVVARAEVPASVEELNGWT